MKTTTIFGEVVDLDAPDLKTRVRLAQRNKDGSWKVNPMLGVHGPDPGLRFFPGDRSGYFMREEVRARQAIVA